MPPASRNVKENAGSRSLWAIRQRVGAVDYTLHRHPHKARLCCHRSGLSIRPRAFR